MSRVLYVPNELAISNSVFEEANKSGIPIQVGDSEHTKNLAFDRDKINIINVDLEESINYFEKVLLNLNQFIKYQTGKYNFNKSITCIINEAVLSPTICERNCVIFYYKCDRIGTNNFSIIFNDKEINSGEFQVYEF